MMRRAAPPRGQRVRLTIQPGLAAAVVRSPAIAAELEAIVARVAAAAQQDVPVADAGDDLPEGRVPGELRDSEEHGVILTVRGFVGVVAYHAYYAAMVHNGTKHSPPNPWLLNAALAVLVA